METQLNPAHFFRLNRSKIIHVRHVERIDPYPGDRLAVRLRGQAQAQALVSSVSRTPELRKWLDT